MEGEPNVFLVPQTSLVGGLKISKVNGNPLAVQIQAVQVGGQHGPEFAAEGNHNLARHQPNPAVETT